MKIVIRHEAASDAESPETPDRTCIWVMGEDGEYVGDPTYLEVGQTVSVEVTDQVETTVTPMATVGEVEQIS